MNAIKIKVAQIHFLSEVLVAVTLLLKLPTVE